MTIAEFPPLESADEYGLLAVGGDLDVSSLLLAYRSGVFPWPILETEHIPWFAPPERALLFLDEYKAPKSLQKFLRKNPYRIAINENCETVIRRCAESNNRAEDDGTWITEAMQSAYTELHRAGCCHSVECYEGEELVGGLYGVSIGKMFAGESMFYEKTNASKIAFDFLVSHLREQGVSWIDCQQITPLFEMFGAREVTREEFMKLLVTAVNEGAVTFP